VITRPCPTPHKKKHATEDDAEIQRTEDGFRYGTALYTYRCICGLFHLTRNDTGTLPAYETAPDDAVARLRTLTMRDFTDLVDADVKRTADLADRLALRHPDNLTRWRWALKDLRADVTRQLATNPDTPQTQAWRAKAEFYRNQVDLCLTECQQLRAQASVSRAA
jgi:hypothetical protein